MTAAVPARPGAAAIIWASVRPRSLTVALTASVTGTAVLVPVHRVAPGLAVAALVLAVLLQAATNVLNDAEDALTGADDYAGSGASLAMRLGWIDPRRARVIAACLFAAAVLLGAGMVVATGRYGLLLLGAAAVIVGWAYTAPPLRLAYRPLGEAASGLAMGFGIVWGTAAVQTSHVPGATWWAAAPLALLTAAILHANNARDRAHDAQVGKRTLATRLSPGAVALELRLLFAGAAAAVVAGLATRGLPLWCAGALLPAALAVRAALVARADLDGRGWTALLIRAVQLHLLTGLLLAAGLLASAA